MSNGIENVAKIIHQQDDELFYIPVNDIYPDPNQPRQVFTEENLSELSASIQAQGVTQPITVRRLNNNQYMIIAGERRWRASKMAELETIPAIVKNNLSTDDISAHQLIENLFREDLNPIELADEIEKQLKILEGDFDPHPVETLCHRLGVTRSWLAKKRAVKKLSDPVQKLMRDGLTQDINVLVKIEKLPDSKKQIFFDLIDSEEITIRDALKAVNTRKKKSTVSNKTKNEILEQNAEEEIVIDRDNQGFSTVQLDLDDVVWLLRKTGWEGESDNINSNNIKDIINQIRVN